MFFPIYIHSLSTNWVCFFHCPPLIQVNQTKAIKGCSLPAGTMVLNDNKSKQAHLASNFFLKKSDNGNNQFQQWLSENARNFEVNAFRKENHNQILSRWPGSNSVYNSIVTKIQKKQKHQLSEADAYLCLLLAIAMVRTKKQEKGEFDPIWTPMEGNNRTAAFAQVLFNSLFDPKEGLLESNSITPEWMINCLSLNPQRKKDGIKKILDGMDFKKLRETQINNDDSVFNQHFHMTVYYGIDKEEFLAKGVTMQEVQRLCQKKSQSYSDAKRLSVIPPETVEVAKNLNAILDLMEDNVKLPAGEHPTFSANGSENGNRYVEFMRFDPKNHLDGRCAIFETRQALAYRHDPTKENAKAWMRSINLGSVVFDKKDQPKPSGNVYHPPFPLDTVTIAKASGNYGNPSEKKQQKWNESVSENEQKTKDVGPKTNANIRIKMGLGHNPLEMEEFTKAVMIISIIQPLSRVNAKVETKTTWALSSEKEQCLDELEFLLRTHIKTSATLDYGSDLKIPKQDVTEKWHSLATKGGAMAPAKKHLAATLFIADMMTALLSVPNGIEKAREFTHVIATAHLDMAEKNDKAVVDILGETCLCWEKTKHLNVFS